MKQTSGQNTKAYASHQGKRTAPGKRAAQPQKGKGVKRRKRGPLSILTDNLTEWLDYLFPARTRRGKKNAPLTLGERYQKLKRDIRHQVKANPHRHFPESDYAVIQMVLFVAGSVPMWGSLLKEKLHFRRKRRMHRHGTVLAWAERMKFHPVAFLTGALAVAVICAALSLYTVGVSVSYQDYFLGYASGAKAVNAVVADIEAVTRETLDDEDYAVDRTLLQVEQKILPRRSITDREQLQQALTAQLGQVTYANVLYVNDSPVAASAHAGAIEELLEQLKIGYITPDTVDSYFVERTEVRQEYVTNDYVMNLGYIAQLLNDTKEAEVSYTVKKGDSPLGICADLGIELSQLKDMNPGYDWSVLRVGDELTVSNAVSYLTVVNVERQDYVTDVPYDVEYTDDDSMYQGEYKVISKGVYGKADVSANVTYINGLETDRQIVATATLLQPVTEQQLRGTKERPSWFPTGSFGWPCNGVITSGFGPRNTGIRGASTYHEGIDIANSYGTPIYASDGGTVTHSGWLGGYGYLVIIDHGNGYQTYYGHNSSLLVKVGDHVYKGQQIARMGSTGVSSGNHCDFRIKLNGTFLNPMNFL